MALSRRSGQRFQASIWPGFVDAMTGLLLVLMFVLTIFMVVQFVLRETISGQEAELGSLTQEIAALSEALGIAQDRGADLDAQLGTARADAAAQARLIDQLTAERDAGAAALTQAQSQITAFEAQVAGLLAAQDRATGEISALSRARDELTLERDNLVSAQEALNLALAQARDEIDAEAEAARLAAARADALDALVADLQDVNARAQEELDQAEADRIADAAAAEALRARLKDADAELTAMTLALEEQRQQAEDTLTMLAAARTAREEAAKDLAAALLMREETDELRDGLDARLDAAASAQRAAETRAVSLETELARALRDLNAAEEKADREASYRATLDDRLADALTARRAAEAEVAALSDGTRGTTIAELEGRLFAVLAEQKEAEAARQAAQDEAELQAALLAAAQEQLSEEAEISSAAQREVEVLNQQVAQLRRELGSLQNLLDAAEAKDAAANIEIATLGSRLNAALARAADEERKRANLEEAERRRLEAERDRLAAEAKDLEGYRSDFFGELRRILDGQDGIRVVGDRFVFSSEVLFQPGKAALSADGRAQISAISETLRRLEGRIPESIDWVIRVDGHTDSIPLSGTGEFADNWELSQARALSVVRFMTDTLGFPPNRLAANGFGQYHPIDPRDTDAARAANRRIELKLTER